jgi:cytochrome c oxidase cbb3-type subunit 3/ubiquinol-cytochrome c reductase cytochrome c subunit
MSAGSRGSGWYERIGEPLLRGWTGKAGTKALSGISAVLLCGLLTVVTGCESNTYHPKEVAENMQPQDITDFEVLFQQNCVGCHGVDGKGGASERLNYPLYLALVPKEAIQKTITYGRPGTEMPPFDVNQGGRLTAKQIGILVDGFEQRWTKPVDFHGLTPPPYYQPADAKIDLADGKKIFMTVCGVCHGEHGVIGPLAMPAYLSLATDQYIRTAVLAGKPDQGMPNWQTLKFGHPLSDQEITDVVGYLSSLRPPEARLAMQQSQAPEAPSPEEAKQTGNSNTNAGNATAQTGASVSHTNPHKK